MGRDLPGYAEEKLINRRLEPRVAIKYWNTYCGRGSKLQHITRLLDRLEKRGLISRCRETRDRRTVLARITPTGLALLARLDDLVQGTHRKQLGHLGEKRLRELSELLTACRSRLV